MRDFLLLLIQGIMDALEEFFESLTAPSAKFTLKAFIYSLVFLGASVLAEVFDISCFVSWQEALTCSLLMLIIVLIDSQVRGSIKTGMGSLKALADKFSYNGDEDVTEESDEVEDEEVVDYGTGE